MDLYQTNLGELCSPKVMIFGWSLVRTLSQAVMYGFLFFRDYKLWTVDGRSYSRCGKIVNSYSLRV